MIVRSDTNEVFSNSLVPIFKDRVIADSGTVQVLDQLESYLNELGQAGIKPTLAMFPSGSKVGKIYCAVPSNGDGDLSVVRAGTTAYTQNPDGTWRPAAANEPRYTYKNGVPELIVTTDNISYPAIANNVKTLIINNKAYVFPTNRDLTSLKLAASKYSKSYQYRDILNTTESINVNIDDVKAAEDIVNNTGATLVCNTELGYKAGKLFFFNKDNIVDNFTVSRATASVQLNENTLEAVAANVPVIDTVAGVKGIRVNPQASNLVSRFIHFTTLNWVKSNIYPEGDPTAAKSEMLTNCGGIGQTDWVDTNGDGVADGVIMGAGGDATTGSIVTGNGFTGNAQRGTAVTNNAFVRVIASLVIGKLYKVSFKYRSNTAINSGNASIWYNKTIPVNEGNAISWEGYMYVIGASTTINFYSTALAGAYIEVDEVSLKEVTGFADPAGGLNAYKLTATANNGTISLTTPTTVVNGTTYTNLIYAKRVTGTGNVNIIDVNNADRLVTVGSDWTPLIDTRAATSTSGQIGIKLATAGDEILIYNANQVAGVIDRPVTINASLDGTLVTRNEDNVSKSNISSLLGASEGTMFIDINLSGGGTNQFPMIMYIGEFTNPSVGSNNNGIYLFSDISRSIRLALLNSSASILTVAPSALQFQQGRRKIALTYKMGTDMVVLAVNGVIIQKRTIDPVKSIPTLNTAVFSSGSTQGNQNIYDSFIMNEHSSDAELIAMTTL